MHKQGLLLILSPLPGLPVLAIGVTIIWNFIEKGIDWNYQIGMLAVVTMLGIVGSLGLVFASLSWTYDKRIRRMLTTSAILCGYVAIAGVIFVFASAIFSDSAEGSNDGTRAFWFLFTILGVLSLPMITGVVAMKQLLGRYV